MLEVTEQLDELTKIRHTVVRYLSRREHSELELRNKLLQKGRSEMQVDEVLADLVRQDLISDERFADAYIRYRSMKGFGPVRIRQELRERGVDSALIDQYLNGDTDWLQKAHEVRLKKFGPELPVEFSLKAKQMRYLQYRGFNHDQISQAFTDT